MSITFSSCFYIFKSKFNPKTYITWMNNFISVVNNFNLVIYCDENSRKYIDTKGKINIKIIIKPLEEFYNYKYKEKWLKNQTKNVLLNDKIQWQVNMLWSEKIWFVNETIQNAYFESEFYGWCDIGYFRNRDNDTNITDLLLSNWPDNNKIMQLDKAKIHYACINNNNSEIKYLKKIIDNKNQYGLPTTQIPPQQQSIAGGFFILHKNNIEWWCKTYDEKLALYFSHDYLVKDDQIILADCIFSNIEKFNLIKENDMHYDNWFLFQRFLL
jgi:hypothetical protein